MSVQRFENGVVDVVDELVRKNGVTATERQLKTSYGCDPEKVRHQQEALAYLRRVYGGGRDE